MADFVVTKLRLARVKKGIKMTSLAEALGVSLERISQIELRKAVASRKLANAIAVYLDVPTEELFDHDFLAKKVEER